MLQPHDRLKKGEKVANIFDEAPTLEFNRTTVEHDIPGEKTGEQSHVMSELRDIDGFRIPAEIAFHNNQLLTLADPILSILLSIPRQSAPYDLNYFRLQVLDLLRDFKIKSIALDYHPSVIEKTVYVLCAALDEAIAHTEWGNSKGWVNHSLLSSMFTQRNGGEIFFVLLDKACQQPKLLIDFIKLVYVLLMLGFKGKYSETDQNELYEIKTYVYSLIEHYDHDNNLYLPKDEANTTRVAPFVGLSFKFILLYMSVILSVILGVKQFRFMFTNDTVYELTQMIDKKISDEDVSTFKSIQSSQVDYKVSSPNSGKNSRGRGQNSHRNNKNSGAQGKRGNRGTSEQLVLGSKGTDNGTRTNSSQGSGKNDSGASAKSGKNDASNKKNSGKESAKSSGKQNTSNNRNSSSGSMQNSPVNKNTGGNSKADSQNKTGGEKGNSMNNSDRKTNSSGKVGKEELTLSQKVESGTYETSGKAAKSDLNKTAESKSK